MKFTSTYVILSTAMSASAMTCKDAIPDGTAFAVETSWDLESESAVTYPCSAGCKLNFFDLNLLL